jgi:hypothetical protein
MTFFSRRFADGLTLGHAALGRRLIPDSLVASPPGVPVAIPSVMIFYCGLFSGSGLVPTGPG